MNSQELPQTTESEEHEDAEAENERTLRPSEEVKQNLCTVNKC